ncbi:MAG: alkaline phosphatase family protein [Firmicutes bacterium]|nr:alkaline phosphatase family protein [Bacillota bacterium]MCM1400396.1 alkaline phosphatase family protein [Bacteroides sp.]MCM1477153.1 alkaline phosphatase family protein [Bacteroides sp.]
MNHSINSILTRIAGLLLFAALLPAVAKAQPAQRPDLVAVITVEGLSADYLHLLKPMFTPGGFNKLMNSGVTFDRIDFGPGIDPAAGTAIIHTGASPMVNGIPAAKVYDVATKLARSPLHDPAMMGNFTDETFSPTPLKVSTIADELRIATNGAGRAYAVAPVNHEAIIGAGHAGNGAFWINEMTGNWATSTYFKEMPAAVKNRNYRNSLASRLDTMRWTPLLNLSLYPGLSRQEMQKPFRINFPSKDVQRVRRYLQSPLSNTEVTDVAIDLINETSLGKGNSTDIISLAYTIPTDASQAEIIDSYLRLDRDLARLFQALPADQSTVLLTGVPSVSGTAPDSKQWNIPSGLYSVKRAISLLDIQLMAVHGNGDWILGYYDRNFYLNRKLIKDRGLNLQDFRREVADFLARMAGVSNVVTIDDIAASRAGDNPRALKRNTSMAHAGDVIIEVSPGWQIIDDGTGKASGVQRHTAIDIPAFIVAPELKRLQITEATDARVLAPTLSRLLLIRAPNGASQPALHLIP